MIQNFLTVFFIISSSSFCYERSVQIWSPDSTQESLVRKLRDGYESDGSHYHGSHSYLGVSLFHFRLEEDLTRLRWRFAAFQQSPDCASKNISVHIRRGSYPIFATSSFPLPKDYEFFMNLTSPPSADFMQLQSDVTFTVTSQFRPNVSKDVSLRNPVAGSWYVAAFIEDGHDDVLKLLSYGSGRSSKCFYSIGCTMITTRLSPHISYIYVGTQSFELTAKFNYFKFEVPKEAASFNLSVKFVNSITENDTTFDCLIHLNVSVNQLPQFSEHNVNRTKSSSFQEHQRVFIENRPYLNSIYYFLVVSNNSCHGSHTLEVNLTVTKTQFGVNNCEPKDNTDHCLNDSSVSNLKRIVNAGQSNVNFYLRYKDWYNNCLKMNGNTVSTISFEIIHPDDLGAYLTISFIVAHSNPSISQSLDLFLSIDRLPEVTSNSSPNTNRTILVFSNASTVFTIPYPLPGIWFLSIRCSNASYSNGSSSNFMLNLDVSVKPCGREGCSGNGICVSSHKKHLPLHACSCALNFMGWSCHQQAPHNTLNSNTNLAFLLILTLSNASFLPVIYFSTRYQLFAQAFVYFATMISSTFYHVCDHYGYVSTVQHLPSGVRTLCFNAYVSREVLQFLDHFCALLSFWMTFVSLCQFTENVTSLLNMVGVIIIAILVEYDRRSFYVFVVPICFAILTLVTSFSVRKLKFDSLEGLKKGCFESSTSVVFEKPRSIILVILSLASIVTAVALFTVVQDDENYAYVHSLWHCLSALSVCFILPLCQRRGYLNHNFESMSTSSSRVSPESSSPSTIELSNTTTSTSPSVNSCDPSDLTTERVS